MIFILFACLLYTYQKAHSTPVNGFPIVSVDGAPPLGHYPHMRRVNNFVYMSGLSSRRPDGSHLGATLKHDGM